MFTSTPNQQVQIVSTEAVPPATLAFQSSQNFVIRAQTPSSVIGKTTTISATRPDSTPKQIQRISLIPNAQTISFQNKPKSTLVLGSSVKVPVQQATYAPANSSVSAVPRIILKKDTKPSLFPSKLIPIRPKETQQPMIQQQVFTISSDVPSLSRITNPLIYPPVPALALIQPKPIKPNESEENVEYSDEMHELDNNDEDNMLDIKRIIEGAQCEIDHQVAIIQSQSSQASTVEYEEIDEIQESSSQSLLCEEIIDSVTPESDKNSGENPTTPVKSDECSVSIGEVRKNLVSVLVSDCDKENLKYIGETDPSDESKATDFEESLQKSEITKNTKGEMMVEISTKPKRVRKPKNPTINASLGLPYKPNSQNNRRSKIEMKLELELDFHDPINKIRWDDGVGGIDNCNKLFGFDEFGLIEVLSKKDLMAKFKTRSEKDDETEKNYKLRKLSDPQDQFTCSVCSKNGTVREFFSPETCSEACMAIMKRKTQSEVNINFKFMTQNFVIFFFPSHIATFTWNT